MRLAIAVCLLLCVAAVGQTEKPAAQTVQRIVEMGSIEGHDYKVLGEMGDAAAVLLTKILAGKDLTSLNINGALVVLKSSFADRNFIAVPDDRQPRTALLVLKYFESCTDDPTLRKEIRKTRDFIQNGNGESAQDRTRN